MKLEGCRPLVTGAARGIGRAFVDAFLAAGAEKVYAGVRTVEAAAAMGGIDPRIVPVILDTTRPEQVAAAAALATDVDILVNNAGVLFYADFMTSPSLDNARQEMEVNYFGPLNTARAFAPALQSNNGAIVNVLSVAALTYIPQVGSYNPSKAAARSMTEGVRHELAPSGVHVYAVYAGGYDTDMHPDSSVRAVLNPPSVLTTAVLEALAADGPENVYPDAMSQTVASSLGLFTAPAAA